MSDYRHPTSVSVASLRFSSCQPVLPPLFGRLVDDAAVFPPGSATLADGGRRTRQHRAAWYAGLVGPLLVPVVGASMS